MLGMVPADEYGVLAHIGTGVGSGCEQARFGFRRAERASSITRHSSAFEQRNMKPPVALKRLSALSQASRLKVFRLLVKAGPDGMAAGRIARKLSIAANTMSAQLQILSNAGLVVARRDGRSILYAADYDAMNDLLVFLTEDCCGGRLEKSPPLAGTVARLSAPAKKSCC